MIDHGISLTLAPSAYITIGLTPVNLARSIDDLIVNQASATLSLSHEKKCEFADQNLLDQQRQQVRNFIRGLKSKLKTIVQNISESRYSNVQQDADNLTANINDSISVNGNNKGFFPQTNQNINDVCNEIQCEQSDFISKPGDYFTNSNNRSNYEKTLKCRIKYKSFNILREVIEKEKLKKYLEATNTLRGLELNGEIYGRKRNERTFGFSIIDNITTNKKEVYPIQVDVKGVSGATFDLPDFAPILSGNSSNRVFSVQIVGSNERGDDTEVRMLEEIAKIYWKNESTRRKVNVELFTDRRTCDGCSYLINKINTKQEKTLDYITINPLLQGIFFGSTPNDLSVVTEKIPLMPKDFYMGIK